jgi:hypothetical protein
MAAFLVERNKALFLPLVLDLETLDPNKPPSSPEVDDLSAKQVEIKSKQIDRLRELTRSVVERRHLLHWFATAYLELPPQLRHAGRWYSRHEAALNQVKCFVTNAMKLRAGGRPAEWPRKPSAKSRIHPDDNASPAHHKSCGCALEVIPDLKLEFEMAIKCCQRTMRQSPSGSSEENCSAASETDKPKAVDVESSDPREAEADLWLYEMWQTGDWTWDELLDKYQKISVQKRWIKLTSRQGIRNRVANYAKARHLPLRRGKGGRPRLINSVN